MKRIATFTSFGMAFFLCALLAHAGGPPVFTAKGKVEKVDKDALTVVPVDANGKAGRPIVLRVTGTSKITTLSTRTDKDKKTTAVQRDTDLRDLQAGQAIAVIFTTLKAKENPVLLSAVAQGK